MAPKKEKRLTKKEKKEVEKKKVLKGEIEAGRASFFEHLEMIQTRMQKSTSEKEQNKLLELMELYTKIQDELEKAKEQNAENNPLLKDLARKVKQVFIGCDHKQFFGKVVLQ